MTRQLKAEDFAAYKPLARKTAIDHLPLLQELPPAFVPFLLKETISLDFKFPAERQELLSQLSYLGALPAAERSQEMAPFTGLRLTNALESYDWVNKPGQFLEQLSAHLWATAQMDTFRSASERYMQHFRKSHPEEQPAAPRLAVVVAGQGVTNNSYPLFRKLRREGTYFKQVKASSGLTDISQLLASRSASVPLSYGHWFIDGGQTPIQTAAISVISYSKLSETRLALTRKMRQAFETRMSSEALRTMLAEVTPEDLGIAGGNGDEVLQRFQLSLLTEGSGTQIYSTTFVQWAAREALRRAKPLTVVARFTPRQREAPMNELLAGNPQVSTDPAGSLVDADMGAWYTWINLQRLNGSDRSSFVAWFEDHNEAVAVGPAFTKGTEDKASIELSELLKRADRTPARA